VYKYIMAVDGWTASTGFPAAIYIPDQRKTFFAWHTDNKKIKVCMYDHAAETYANIVEVDDLSDLGALDAHHLPAISVLPNDKLLIVYGCHNSNPIYKISTNAHDITAWGSRLAISRAHTYPQLIAYPNPSTPTKLVLFLRHFISGTQSSWERYETVDGSSWGSPTEIINFGDGESPYMVFVQRSSKILASGFSYNHAGALYDDYYFAYSEDDGDTWKKVNGTGITLPIDATEMFAITASTVCAEPFPTIDENGKPVMMGTWWDDHSSPTTGKFRIAWYSVTLGSSGSWSLDYIEDNGGTDYLTNGLAMCFFLDPTYNRPAFWSYNGESVFNSGYTGKFVRQAGGTKKFDKIYEDNGRLRGGRFRPFPVEQNENFEDPIEVFFTEEGNPP